MANELTPDEIVAIIRARKPYLTDDQIGAMIFSVLQDYQCFLIMQRDGDIPPDQVFDPCEGIMI